MRANPRGPFYEDHGLRIESDHIRAQVRRCPADQVVVLATPLPLG